MPEKEDGGVGRGRMGWIEEVKKGSRRKIRERKEKNERRRIKIRGVVRET